jgi:hypothetical protein
MTVSLRTLLSEDDLALMRASGTALVRHMSMDVLRGVVLDVLMGRNIRTATEVLTRRRIAALNLAMLRLFLRGRHTIEQFIDLLPAIAVELLSTRGAAREDRQLAQWVLGLTDKGVQNILRDDLLLLQDYQQRYVETTRHAVIEDEIRHGRLSGSLSADEINVSIDGLFLSYLLNAVGAQTLTVRGSDKSTYGKLFEPLILGAMLHLLGFRLRQAGVDVHAARTFWLASRDEERESDATLLYEPGKGIRFDIGFIGRGNTEISLDKVSRYRSEAEIGRETWFMATIIIVDRIGERSRIEEMARRINGTIVQMSAGYWIQRIARTLHDLVGFQHPLLTMTHPEIADYLTSSIHTVPLDLFIPRQQQEPPHP